MNKVSNKILKLYSKNETLSMFDITDKTGIKSADLAEPILELIEKNLICKMLNINDFQNDKFDPEAQYCITHEGRSYLESLKNDKFKYYFQIIIQLITTIIAVAAFIKSFFVST